MINNNMRVKFREENIKQTMINVMSEAKIDIVDDVVDIVVVELPDNKINGKEYRRVEPDIHVWLSGTPIEDAIRALTQKSYKEVKAEELCSSIEQLLLESGNETAFSSVRTIKSGMYSGSASQYFLLIIVGLKKAVSDYAELLKYVVEDIKEKLTSAGDFLHVIEKKNENENQKESGKKREEERLFGNLRKNWILLGKFVEYYMEQSGLPKPEVMTRLSATHYEGSESEARIYFTHRAINTLEVLCADGEKDREINEKNVRMIRKLMEISKRNTAYLYAEKKGKEKLYTISRLVQCRKQTEEDIYVKFSGFMHWSLFEGEREIFSYYHGRYEFNATKEDRSYIKKIEEFRNVDQRMIRELVEILRNQKHGTAAVLFDNNDRAKYEADRLCQMKRGIRILSNICYDKESGWNEEQILSVTGIDGALFIDHDGKCLAIGVIVDGEITIIGDAGRGARYNSIANYIELNKNCVGIVISEDGMVNVIQNTDHSIG